MTLPASCFWLPRNGVAVRLTTLASGNRSKTCSGAERRCVAACCWARLMIVTPWRRLTSLLAHGSDRAHERSAARVAERPDDVRAPSRHDVVELARSAYADHR